MKTNLFLILSLLMFSGILKAQDKYMTKVGHIQFYSHAQMEDIKANNNEVTSVINIKSGEMAFIVLMKSFKFKNALMEEHFNENYVESDKFPKAKFKGTIADMGSVDLSKIGLYNVAIEGDLEIHGIIKHIIQKGTLEVKEGQILGKSKFNILLKDYGLIIESALSEKIAESIEITVDMVYEPMK